MRKAYISFLAIQDILDLAEDRLRINDSEKFRSEGELAFFEKRGIADSPLFQNERLKEIFPEYAEMKYVFTGSLMSRLLWKESKTPIAGEKMRARKKISRMFSKRSCGNYNCLAEYMHKIHELLGSFIEAVTKK